MIEKFKSSNQEIPVVVSKNRLKASMLCLQDASYANLRDIYETGSLDLVSMDSSASENHENGIADGAGNTAYNINITNRRYGENENRNKNENVNENEFSPHCLYVDVHDKYEKYKKISIIDDGFTALNIKKNLDIILIDGTKNLFGQFVIPAGVLREPVSSVKYSNCIIISKTAKRDEALETEIRKYNKSCPIFYSYYVPSNIKGGLGGKQVIPCRRASACSAGNEKIAKKAVVICGIGNPEYFYTNVKGCGFDILDTLEYGDHHNYKDEDVLKLKSIADSREDITVITTLKDYVKLKNFKLKFSDVVDKLYYLDFEVKIDNKFYDFITEKYFDYIGNTKSELAGKIKNSLVNKSVKSNNNGNNKNIKNNNNNYHKKQP